jgi:ornithine cyclodeaminase
MLDVKTGAPAAFLDGRYITEARTAAVSAVSTRHLARADAATMAILGSGVQARSHLEAIACVRKLGEVRVWSRNPEHRERYAEEMQGQAVPATLRATSSAEEAVHNADIIVLATSAQSAVIQNEWVSDGAHICAVGACRPDAREMTGELVARGRVFVDSRVGALAEAGDVVLAMREGLITAEHVAAELGDVVAGRAAGRCDQREVTIFKSLGMAVEDVAAAHLAWMRARERGLGRTFSF